jgi:hypothetical protein
LPFSNVDTSIRPYDNVKPMDWKTASLFAVVVLVGCVLWLGLNNSIFGTSATTIVIQVLAISLVVWARFTFGIRSFHAAANPTAGGLSAATRLRCRRSGQCPVIAT